MREVKGLELNHEVEAAASDSFARTQKSDFASSFPISPFPQHRPGLFFWLTAAMAEGPGVTEASLKTKITELLQATHVEIEDMSGTFSPHYAPLSYGLSN